MDAYRLKQRAYEAEVKRQGDQYGQEAEMSSVRYPIGATPGMLHVPVQPAAVRIAEMARQVAETAQQLAEARSQQRASAAHLSKCEAEFAQISDVLLKAIHEHREGTPENVPYGP